MPDSKNSADTSFLAPGNVGGWRRYQFNFGDIWFCGHLYDHSDPTAALSAWPDSNQDDDISSFLNKLDGHFAVVCSKPDVTIAAVDPVRSVPIFFAGSKRSGLKISANSVVLAQHLQLEIVDIPSARSLAMSGYTIGSRTLYRDLQQLCPGEFVVIRSANAHRARYHRYSPWLVTEDDEQSLQRKLADITIALFERMAKQSSGRQIAIPLSAGRDSRLIVSALAEIGARNVVCFAYGLPGNFEMRASEKIARHLGFDWHFVPFTPRSQRQFWHGEQNYAYQEFADSSCSTTVVHDFPAIDALLKNNIIDRRSIVINGNSGDYISGLHIQPPVDREMHDLSFKQRKQVLVDTLIKKHFRLWNALATESNDRMVEEQLYGEIDLLRLGEMDPTQTHGIYEYLEFQDRQSKYVISRQRIYEFLGLEWRLPLWSRAYLDFWQGVPLRLKRGQRLYARTLQQENWGGVWQGSEWAFPRRVSPEWMRLAVRPALKTLSVPFGREAWQRFERRYLSYWTDLFALHPIEPYLGVARDQRGARHAISWQTARYLQRKGLSWDGVCA